MVGTASWTLPYVPLDRSADPGRRLDRLRDALGGGPRLLVKRDDTIGFAFGGNKVRKMSLVAADAIERGADTLITSGGVQSNHARVTAAAAARLGLRCILVVNGTAQEKPTANALLDRLLGAEVRYVRDRSERAPAMDAAAEELRRQGRKPYVIPIGASTPLGAAAFVHAVAELQSQDRSAGRDRPLHLLRRHPGGPRRRMCACRNGDESHRHQRRRIGGGAGARHPRDHRWDTGACWTFPPGGSAIVRVEVDDRFVGGGYGVPTDESREAIELCARTEALFLDPTYTAKAMAGLIAGMRAGEFKDAGSVLFWHTGGQVGLFA